MKSDEVCGEVGIVAAGWGVMIVFASLHKDGGFATWPSLAGSGAELSSVSDSAKTDSLSLVAACSASQGHCENCCKVASEAAHDSQPELLMHVFSAMFQSGIQKHRTSVVCLSMLDARQASWKDPTIKSTTIYSYSMMYQGNRASHQKQYID